MTTTSQEDKKVKATSIYSYREGGDIEPVVKSGTPRYNGGPADGVKCIANHFPHIIGCELTASCELRENRLGADIRYIHTDTNVFIQIVILPVERNKVAIMVRRAVDWSSPVVDKIISSSTEVCVDDHAATVTVGKVGTSFPDILRVVGDSLSNSVRVSIPLFLDTSATPAEKTPAEKHKDGVGVVEELDKIAKSLGDRIHEHYGHKIDTKA